MEGARVLAGKLERVEIGGELGGGSGVTAGGIGGGELGHEEVPGGGPGGTDGGDEELGREGVAPEELGDGGEWLLEGHSKADVGSGGGEGDDDVSLLLLPCDGEGWGEEGICTIGGHAALCLLDLTVVSYKLITALSEGNVFFFFPHFFSCFLFLSTFYQ